MIGTIGFGIGAFTIGLFAATSWRAYRFANPRQLQLFVTAFGLFAVAMVCWAFATATHNPSAFQVFTFAADALLAGGTLCMAIVLIGRMNTLLNIGLGSIVALALGLRAFRYPSTAFVHDGLLHFNLQGGVRTVILLSFVLVWLPAMIQVAYSVARDPALAALRGSLTSSYVALVLTAALFLSARRPGIIISLFAIIAFLFLVMSLLNIVLIRLHSVPTVTHRKARAS